MMQGMLMYAFAAAVVGGLDSPGGTVIGGLLLGVVENLSGRWEIIGAELQTIVALALLIAMLMIRPRGLFGRPQVRKV